MEASCAVLPNNYVSCPSIWATLSALLINILQVPSSCFCIVISLSEGEIIHSAVSASRGEAALSTPEAVVASRMTDRLPRCATDDDQRQRHHAEHHFQL